MTRWLGGLGLSSVALAGTILAAQGWGSCAHPPGAPAGRLDAFLAGSVDWCLLFVRGQAAALAILMAQQRCPHRSATSTPASQLRSHLASLLCAALLPLLPEVAGALVPSDAAHLESSAQCGAVPRVKLIVRISLNLLYALLILSSLGIIRLAPTSASAPEARDAAGGSSAGASIGGAYDTLPLTTRPTAGPNRSAGAPAGRSPLTPASPLLLTLKGGPPPRDVSLRGRDASTATSPWHRDASTDTSSRDPVRGDPGGDSVLLPTTTLRQPLLARDSGAEDAAAGAEVWQGEAARAACDGPGAADAGAARVDVQEEASGGGGACKEEPPREEPLCDLLYRHRVRLSLLLLYALLSILLSFSIEVEAVARPASAEAGQQTNTTGLQVEVSMLSRLVVASWGTLLLLLFAGKLSPAPGALSAFFRRIRHSPPQDHAFPLAWVAITRVDSSRGPDLAGGGAVRPMDNSAVSAGGSGGDTPNAPVRPPADGAAQGWTGVRRR